MELRERRTAAADVRRDVPVWLLDEGRNVIRTNLLMLWVYGVLRVGEACDPGFMVGRHAYESLARAIEGGRLLPRGDDNGHFIVGRLRAVLGKPDEQLPAVRRFLAAVYASPDDRKHWERQVARAYDGHGDPFALDQIHYPVVVRSAERLPLRFLVTVERLADGGRLITYDPFEEDDLTGAVVAAVRDQLERAYPTVSYVQDVSHLTEIVPRDGDNAGADQRKMEGERKRLPVGGDTGLAEGAAGPAVGSAPSGVEWRPPAPYPREAIDHAFGRESRPLPDHPVFGPGVAWAFEAEGVAPTRVELFPERRWANLRFVDGSAQPRERGLIVDFLAVRRNGERPVLSLASTREGSGSLVNVYPNGDIDEFLRRGPSLHGLPPEALIFDVRAAPLAGPPEFGGPALGVVDAAARLGLGPEAVRVMLRTGQLAGFKDGHVWRVPADAVEAARATRRRPVSPSPKKQEAAYNRAYYEQKKQDPAWRERRRQQARESMRRRRELANADATAAGLIDSAD